MKNVQLFTKGENCCEVNATLKSIDCFDGTVHLITKDEGKIWEYYFPLWNVSMVRISEDD